MKLYTIRTGFLLMLIAITVLYPSVIAQAGPLDPSEFRTIAVNRFALNLYGKLKKSDENLFFSPYSASVALSMLYAGARGSTADQLGNLLYCRGDRDRLAEVFVSLENSMLSRLNPNSGRKGFAGLNIANAIWEQKGLGFRKGFLEFPWMHYGASLRELDFAGAPEQARNRINAWTDRQTEGRIKNFIPPGKMWRNTLLVLTNAIYFKNTWEHQFSKSKTKVSDFTLRNGRKISVSMMHQKERFRYMEGPGFQALELPYRQGFFSMVVFLPRRHDGLERFEKSVNSENLGIWLAVRLFLPRFRLRGSFSLKKTLESVGMTDAFSPRANFAGMTSGAGLYLTEAHQAIYIQVDEKGTEAAAASRIFTASAPQSRCTNFARIARSCS